MHLSAQDFVAKLADIGLTQVGLAKLIGVADITARRWKREGIEGPAAVLVALLSNGTVTIKEIEHVHRDRRPGPVTVEAAQAERNRLALKARGQTSKRRRSK